MVAFVTDAAYFIIIYFHSKLLYLGEIVSVKWTVQSNIHLLTTPPPPPLEALGWAPAFIEGDLDPTLVALAEAGCKIINLDKFIPYFGENLSDKLKERAVTCTYHLGWSFSVDNKTQTVLTSANAFVWFLHVSLRGHQLVPSVANLQASCCRFGTAEREQKTGAALDSQTL